MRALKVFVIAGGIVLVGGAVLLVALIVTRATGDRPTEDRSVAAGAPAAAPEARPVETVCHAGSRSAEPAAVPLPAGARIEQVVPANGCLILLGVDGTGRQFVALVDPFSGARISLLRLRPEE